MCLLPYISGSKELKSKPTQHSVKELLSIGIQPNILVLRSEMEIPEDMKQKIGLFCNVRAEDVIQNLTAPSLYEVPLWLEKEGLADVVCHHLKLECRQPDLKEWQEMIGRVHSCNKKVTIGLVGKYVELEDAYLSVAEALRHGGFENSAEVDIKWIQSENLNENTVAEMLHGCDGIIVPGGFGDRGIEGMIEAIKYAREHKIPMFGICLGMQMSVVEFARHVAGLEGANSSEFGDTPYPVIDIMDSQKDTQKRAARCVLAFIHASLQTIQDVLRSIQHHKILSVSVIVTVGSSIMNTESFLKIRVLCLQAFHLTKSLLK